MSIESAKAFIQKVKTDTDFAQTNFWALVFTNFNKQKQMKNLLALMAFIVYAINGISQTVNITLTFSAMDSVTGNQLALDSVQVTNLTENCDTTLQDSISVLSLNTSWPVGINESTPGEPSSLNLMQNIPNPFRGTTRVRIWLKNDCDLNLTLYNNEGKVLSEYHNRFEKGWRLFGISSGETGMLFLRSSDNSTTKTIRIVSAGGGDAANRITSQGALGQIPGNVKSALDTSSFIFYLGNQLMYTAYANGYNDKTLYDSPTTSTIYTFLMAPAGTAPTVTTTAVTNITQTTATSGGNVTSDGGYPVLTRGVCWSTSANPTTANSHTTDGTGTGPFVSNITGLTGATLYHVRAYATNTVGTSYGSDLTFTTLNLPTVTTTAVTNITTTSATSGGNVTADGGATVTARGVCWSISANPTTANSHTTDGTGTGTFVSNITGLTGGTMYHVRAYATNTIGTAYGNEVSFTTSTCGSSITINHVAGSVAPVTKTTTYSTVTNVPGETSKCWITSNLGSDHQATAKDDATEASAGWYWQFNSKQGYKHDGTTRTPNTTWITYISEGSAWVPDNDPCTIELGTGWRIPTNTEWTNVDAAGNWTNWNDAWNSALKMHAAGNLESADGSLYVRGELGYYWSSVMYTLMHGRFFTFDWGSCYIGYAPKASGFPLRCIKE